MKKILRPLVAIMEQLAGSRPQRQTPWKASAPFITRAATRHETKPGWWKMGWVALLLVACMVVLPGTAAGQKSPETASVQAAQPPRIERVFREARAGGGELRYINQLPVLMLQGTPEQMGRQSAALMADALAKVGEYPRRLLKLARAGERWEDLVAEARALLANAPADHRREMKAFAAACKLDAELGLMANTLPDMYRAHFGCSSLIVSARRSATGGPLFGRNLDFYTQGFLEKYSLVAVYRPTGKHAFVSVGFPGLFGCLSGMNDAGLALAVHEVYFSSDDSPMFDPEGVPYLFAFRRVLEECTTVNEAAEMLRGMRRTTKLNLAVCDPHDAAVLEMTPKTLHVRRCEEGLLACTNHFRTEGLALLRICPRYNRLMEAQKLERIDLKEMREKLRQVAVSRLTVQTMIFEPAALKLHLAIGACPAATLPMHPLDLKPLFGSPNGR